LRKKKFDTFLFSSINFLSFLFLFFLFLFFLYSFNLNRIVSFDIPSNDFQVEPYESRYSKLLYAVDPTNPLVVSSFSRFLCSFRLYSPFPLLSLCFSLSLPTVRKKFETSEKTIILPCRKLSVAIRALKYPFVPSHFTKATFSSFLPLPPPHLSLSLFLSFSPAGLDLKNRTHVLLQKCHYNL
jgi:hypothetical protein